MKNSSRYAILLLLSLTLTLQASETKPTDLQLKINIIEQALAKTTNSEPNIAPSTSPPKTKQQIAKIQRLAQLEKAMKESKITKSIIVTDPKIKRQRKSLAELEIQLLQARQKNPVQPAPSPVLDIDDLIKTIEKELAAAKTIKKLRTINPGSKEIREKLASLECQLLEMRQHPQQKESIARIEQELLKLKKKLDQK